MTKEITKEKIKKDQKSDREKEHHLILINDDFHSFEYVIDALVDVCDHTLEQATQCTMITHYKGQCDVKKGSFKELRSLRRGLIEKQLKAKIS